MNMTQIVIGAALGYLIAHGVLSGARLMAGRLRFDPVRTRMRSLTSTAGMTIVGGFIKYAGVVGVVAALVTLGFWGIGDYRAAKSARSAASADVFDAPQGRPPAAARATPEQFAQSASPPDAASATVSSSGPRDPYADSDFRIQPRVHRSGGRFEETLLRRSEAKARTALLGETRLHARRSQYDCEASDRAERYLKAGLDVWGFAAWQVKYFPVTGYRGATLPACKGIKEVVDPARFHWQSTVAQQQDHP